MAVARVVRFICVNPDCRATWRVLLAWLARHLWWTWSSVEQAVSTDSEEFKAAAVAATPPERTEQRWLKRLASSARQAVVLMVSRGTALARAVGEAVGLQATRRTLVGRYRAIVEAPRGHVLAAVAAVLDRLCVSCGDGQISKPVGTVWVTMLPSAVQGRHVEPPPRCGRKFGFIALVEARGIEPRSARLPVGSRSRA